MKRILLQLFSLCLAASLALSACSAGTSMGTPVTTTVPEQTASSAAPLVETPSPTDPPAATPTSTAQPPLALLLAPEGAPAGLVNEVFSALQTDFTQAGWRWEVRSTLTQADLEGQAVGLVVALPPFPDLVGLAAAASQVQFLALGFRGLQPTVNLSLVGTQGDRPDQQGFIAGVIAAMITPDWRVGVIGPGDTPSYKAIRQGFLNGAVFFCGLCLPYHGPSVDYPVYLDLPSGSGAAEVQALMQNLQDKAVKTAYLAPGLLTPELVAALAPSGVQLMGSEPPPPELAENWVLTIQADPIPAALELLPTLLSGQGGQSRELPLAFQHVNPDLFSQGRQALAQEVLADLLSGYIDTSVDPDSGDPR
jgi:hypothetical protein